MHVKAISVWVASADNGFAPACKNKTKNNKKIKMPELSLSYDKDICYVTISCVKDKNTRIHSHSRGTEKRKNNKSKITKRSVHPTHNGWQFS